MREAYRLAFHPTAETRHTAPRDGFKETRHQCCSLRQEQVRNLQVKSWHRTLQLAGCDLPGRRCPLMEGSTLMMSSAPGICRHFPWGGRTAGGLGAGICWWASLPQLNAGICNKQDLFPANHPNTTPGSFCPSASLLSSPANVSPNQSLSFELS